jgi:hypothetical protein
MKIPLHANVTQDIQEMELHATVVVLAIIIIRPVVHVQNALKIHIPMLQRLQLVKTVVRVMSMQLI